MPQRRSHFPGASSSSTPKKRALSIPANPTPPSRQSKRLKTTPISSATKTTPKKSPYFEPSSSESEPESLVENEESGYEDEDASLVSSPPESDIDLGTNEDEYKSEEDELPKKKKKKPGRKPGQKTEVNNVLVDGKEGQELWRPGVKVDMEAGEAVFIPLPKAREAGKTPYQAHTIHPNTLLFLGDLRKHNDREWLKVHDADYRQAKKDWDSFVESLTEKIIEKDDTVPELPAKDLTFRIYRDIRFSPDPTPYKTHFSAAWSRTGRKGPYAGYYVQIQPGEGSFVGAGLWHPEAPPLALLRKDVDKKSHKLKEVLMGDRLRKEFMGGVSKDVGAVVKKFVAMNRENALKTKPRDYDVDNPNIALLRLRNFTIGKPLKDDEVLGKGGLDRIADLMGILMPFVSYLNSVVMPDEDPSEENDNDGEEAEEEEDEDEEGDEE